MDRYALITAGGTGTRMESEVPKQFLEVGGLPILMHTLRLFNGVTGLKGIIVTLPSDVIQQWNYLVANHGETAPHRVVAGGRTRSESVRNGLMHIPDGSVVAIHDAVRPFTSPACIESAFRKAEESGGAVVGLPCQDSLRRFTRDGSEGIPREGVYLVQTPQTFQTDLIRWAYEMADLSQGFTDDASVFEAAGNKVVLVEGSTRNFKITTQGDLEYARFLVMKNEI